MKFCFLNEYEGEKEIALNDTNVKFTYKEDGQPKIIELDYENINSVSFYKYNEVFVLTLVSDKIVVDLNIEFNDKEKIKISKELYSRMLSIYKENRPEEKIYHYLKENEQGVLMEFNIQSKIKDEIGIRQYGKKRIVIILSVLFMVSTLKILNII